VLSYARQSEKVDVRMTIADEVGRQSQYMASYLGMAPAPAAPEPVAAPAKEREQVAKLKADLAAQTARAARLEQTLDRTRAELRAAQQRRRLENQAPANQ
jgi:chorismate mutase